MFFLSNIRERKIKPKVKAQKNFYSEKSNYNKAEYQLKMFNKQWKQIYKNVPYYKKLVKEKKIAKNIKTWEDFLMLPIGDRSYIRENVEQFSNMSKKPDQWISTGGSTGTPLNFPKWNSEQKYKEVDTWHARTFYDIKRSDKMLRVWGHAHTLGKGLSKYKNIIKLKIGHLLIGYKRLSVYDLSEEKMKIAGEKILKFKPDYIITYSKVLTQLAKYNEDKKNDFHKLNLKAVIGAAEGFDHVTDQDIISDIFGCRVGQEYSSMETLLLAHTHPNGGYKVFWGNNLIECVDDKGNPANTGRVLVTTLYPRAFPLVRYELGDIIVNTKNDGHSVYEFERVRGRDNDFLELDNNTKIHPQAISNAVSYFDKVSAYQIRYTDDYKYTLYLKSNYKITSEEKAEIRNRLIKIDRRLSVIEIKQVDFLKQTIAGKTKWLIKE